MLSSPIRTGDITFDAFLNLVPDGQKADLLDGVIYMASPDNTEAGDLNSWLAHIIFGFVAEKDLGKVYLVRVAYKIGPKRGPEPDIGFVPKRLENTRRRGYIAGPPQLAVEIVSPDSVQRDYIHKRKIYEEAGVPEYWILDPDVKRATFLRLHAGRYKAVVPVRHIFRSQVLPGFFLDVRWLWLQRRPSPYQILQQILSGKGPANGRDKVKAATKKKPSR